MSAVYHRTVFIVEPDGGLSPVTLRPLNKQENASVRRERVRLSEGGDGTI